MAESLVQKAKKPKALQEVDDDQGGANSDEAHDGGEDQGESEEKPNKRGKWFDEDKQVNAASVSYTHLTLPTILLV
eukprot:4798764-Amphidinium_carterae.1